MRKFKINMLFPGFKAQHYDSARKARAISAGELIGGSRFFVPQARAISRWSYYSSTSLASSRYISGQS